ncbi:MAG: hypothetical protein ACKVOR_07525 [Flavobacteriales bacterium]
MYFVYKQDKQALSIQPHVFYQICMLGLIMPIGVFLLLIFSSFGPAVVAMSFIATRIALEYLMYKKMTTPNQENTEVL